MILVRIGITAAAVGGEILAQAAPNDPTSSVLSLGVAGLVAVVAMLWQRDTARQRDKAQDSLAQIQPLLEQIKEVLVTSTEAHRAGIDASREASRAVRDLPPQQTWGRLIAALENSERRDRS